MCKQFSFDEDLFPNFFENVTEGTDVAVRTRNGYAQLIQESLLFFLQPADALATVQSEGDVRLSENQARFRGSKLGVSEKKFRIIEIGPTLRDAR
jgi:hypothetical protein